MIYVVTALLCVVIAYEYLIFKRIKERQKCYFSGNLSNVQKMTPRPGGVVRKAPINRSEQDLIDMPTRVTYD